MKPINLFNKRIDELIQRGKSSGAIEQIVKKEFPEVARKLEEHIIPLRDGSKINRLRAQIQDRVEKFRNKLEEKSDDDGR